MAGHRHYICKEKYRLELHWDSIEYRGNGVANLKGAYFSGPALSLAQQIQAPDTISLDLTPQHLIVLDSYYIVKLVWKGVQYKDEGKVHLTGAQFSNRELKSLHKLENDDYIVIDTEKHEEKTHAYHLVYDSQVLRKDREPYKYTKDKQ